MEYKKLNESFARRFKLCESEDVVAYTKYTKDHEDLAPKKSPAFEVTKKNWKEQITGSNKATRLNTTAVRGKVKDFFEKHPNADYAYIIINHDKVSISAKKPTNESYIAEGILDIFKKKNKGDIFKEASIKEIAEGADPIDFSDEVREELLANTENNTGNLKEGFDIPYEDDDYDLMDLMDADLIDDSEEEFDDEYDPEDDLMFNDGIDALEGQHRWNKKLVDPNFYYGDDIDPLEYDDYKY